MSFRHPVIFCHFTPHTIQFSMSSRRSQLGRRWCMWYASFICVLWLMYMCAMTHMYAMRDWHSATLPHAQSSPRCVHVDRSWVARAVHVTCLIHMCIMTNSYVCHDSYVCHKRLTFYHTSSRKIQSSMSAQIAVGACVLYMWHDSFKCVLWLMHMCSMTQMCAMRDWNSAILPRGRSSPRWVRVDRG